MAGFKVDAFRGIRPRISARKLPPGEAQTAENVKLGSNDLELWSGSITEAVLAGSAINKIYRFDNSGAPVWFEFTNADVSIAPGAVKDDILERTYYTGDGFPKMTYNTIAATGAAPYPNDFRRLGLPAPTTAPVITPPSLTGSTVGNVGTITDGMTSDKFYLTIIVSVFDTVTSFTPPYDTRVYVQTDSADPLIGQNIDVGIEIGDVYKVTVTDADNFTLTNESSEYLSKSPVPTSPRDGSTPNSTLVFTDGASNYANFAGYLHAPQGLKVNKTAHGLNNNSEIVVTSVNVPVRYRWNTPNTDNPPGAGTGQLPYFTLDYPDTGPYPTAPDNTEITTHECTYDTAGDYFDLYGTFAYEVISDGDGSGDIVEERSYVYTWVTALGEEGPPSPPSAFTGIVDGTSVTIGTFDTVPGAGDGYDIANIRIYRTNSTEDTADFQFVAEILDTDPSYADTILNSDLGEILPSTDWDRPSAGMQGITTMPNGMMIGFEGKTVYFCEPYFPHAWPAIYDQAVDFDIVGIASVGNSAVIVTNGTPYILSGAHPRNASIRPYKINQSCTNAQSIASTTDRVLYSSPDGIVQIGVDGAKIATEQYFTKREWQDFLPNSLVSAVYDNRYYGFFVSDPADADLPEANTLVYVGKSAEGAIDSEATSFCMSHDGVYAFSIPRNSSTGTVVAVHRHVLSTPFDITTINATPDQISTPLNWEAGATDFRGAFWSEDGLTFYYVSRNEKINQQTITTPYDVTELNTNADKQLTGVAGGSNQLADFCMSGDGTKIAICSGSTTEIMVKCYTLSTPYDVSTATEVRAGNGFTTGTDTTMSAIEASADGKRFWILLGGSTQTNGNMQVITIDVPTAWDELSAAEQGTRFSLQSRTTDVNPAKSWVDLARGLYYVMWYNNALTDDCFIEQYSFTPQNQAFVGDAGHIVFSPDDASIGMSTGTTVAVGVHVDIEEDALYYTDGGEVFEWDANPAIPLTALWKSGVYLTRSPVNMGAAIVEAETYPVTFRLYANGVLKDTVAVADNEPFRLPGGYLASRFEVEIEGTSVVNEVRVAESVFELSDG